MPGKTADKITRCPANPTTRSTFGYLTSRCLTQCGEDFLANLCQALIETAFFTLFWLSSQIFEIRKIHVIYMFTDLSQIPSATSRTFSQGFSSRRLNSLIEFYPACLQDFLKSLKFAWRNQSLVFGPSAA